MPETTEEFVKNQREQCKANENLSQYGKSKGADYLAKKLLDACNRLEQLERTMRIHAGDICSINNENERFAADKYEAEERADTAEAKIEQLENLETIHTDQIESMAMQIERLQEALKKYGQHTNACHSRFIDSALDSTCNTFGKCNCGFVEMLE